MGLKPTLESLNLLRTISKTVDTWHHYHHILLDIANQNYSKDEQITYCEIGCYAGASSCLMLQRPKTRVISIDPCTVVPPLAVKNNISRYTKHGNEWYCILEDSHTIEAKKYLSAITNKVDILFIDGGHEYRDVIKDFLIYERFVPKGGWIIFDDYRNYEFKGVLLAVEDIRKHFPNYEYIGLIENSLRARGDSHPMGACFVTRKTNG